jgi:hypothetical protein
LVAAYGGYQQPETERRNTARGMKNKRAELYSLRKKKIIVCYNS